MSRAPLLVPIIEPLDIRTAWEHTPLDYYRYGEYPRFQRPVGAHQPRVRFATHEEAKAMGWPKGLEPSTTGITILDPTLYTSST